MAVRFFCVHVSLRLCFSHFCTYVQSAGVRFYPLLTVVDLFMCPMHTRGFN